MDEYKVTNRACMNLLRQRMCRLFWKIAEEREEITVDGVPGYNEKAQFVGGKVINLCTYVALNFAEDENERDKMLGELSGIVDMCAGMKMETWGILNGLTGLYRLKEAGVYRRVVSRETDETLKRIMDWHTFVDEEKDYALIHKPTNYYGVAFGIARFRELMGWDPVGKSEILLEHLLNHISRYSGEYGFMDETQGEGRFDRYSLLIPAEITELVLKTGWKEPELIRNMLKESAQIILQMANQEGWGISYGRSIGAYGETAVLQILGTAVSLDGILSPEEERLAYSYSLRCIRSMILFWYDEQMQSINMWEKGRRTDGYRNKNRILGENLSLSMQVIDVIEQWRGRGYDVCQEFEETDLADRKRDGLYFTRFAKSEYDRGLVIFRSNGHVWSLPFISGGTPYYNKDAYLPVPRENGVLEAVPDVTHGALVPCLKLEDGTEVMPICFYRSIELEEENTVRIYFDHLCWIGENSPVPCEGIRAVTTYRFGKQEIDREDVFVIDEDSRGVKEISLCFDTFSEEPSVNGCLVSFKRGPVCEVKAEGYDCCEAFRVETGSGAGQMELAVDLSMAGMKDYQKPEDSFGTPHGANESQVRWTKCIGGINQQEIRVNWKIRF